MVFALNVVSVGAVWLMRLCIVVPGIDDACVGTVSVGPAKLVVDVTDAA